MKALIVVSVDVPTPEDVPEVLKKMDPTRIPGFAGEVRIVVGSDVADTIKFLDEG